MSVKKENLLFVPVTRPSSVAVLHWYGFLGFFVRVFVVKSPFDPRKNKWKLNFCWQPLLRNILLNSRGLTVTKYIERNYQLIQYNTRLTRKTKEKHKFKRKHKSVCFAHACCLPPPPRSLRINCTVALFSGSLARLYTAPSKDSNWILQWKPDYMALMKILEV